jgi:hypothetical protein
MQERPAAGSATVRDRGGAAAGGCRRRGDGQASTGDGAGRGGARHPRGHRGEFRKLLPKRGEILLVEESTDELDGEGGRKKTSEEKLPVRDLGLRSLPAALREHVGPVETHTVGHAETVDLSFDENGLLEMVSKTVWSGCPC